MTVCLQGRVSIPSCGRSDSTSCYPLHAPVLYRLSASPGSGTDMKGLFLRHKTLDGSEVMGVNIQVSGQLLTAGEEGRIVNRQMVSRLVENYFIIEAGLVNISEVNRRI